jgi:23S rRNA (guanosine2251-2'-O)-methyltransferase
VSGALVLYGRNPIREALRARRRPVHRVWATRGAAAEPWLRDVEVIEARPEEITARTGTEAHQGLCAEVGSYPYVDEAGMLAGPDPLIVVLDELQDPQNLGAICRTAECVGADGVVIPQRRSAEVTPAACKASAGAVEHLAIARVRNVADFLASTKEVGCWCYGATAEDGEPYLKPDYSGGCVLVIGAEGRGLRPRVAAACDRLVALPLRGHVQSLNASATAAALLYGILQRRSDA